MNSSQGPATRGKPDPGTGIVDTGVGSFSPSLGVPEEDSEELSTPVSSVQNAWNCSTSELAGVAAALSTVAA